jgi:hypothetical protein
MTITDVRKIWSGESASFSKELDFSDRGEADYAEVYDCISSDGTDTVLDVRTASGIPQLGEQKGSEFLWVTNVQVSRESPIYYRVAVSYKSFSVDPSDPTSNPLLAPAKVKWKTVKTEGEIDEDVNGNPIVTTAGEPVRGITRPFSDIAAVITQAFSAFNPFTFYLYIDYVNSDFFLGFPPGTAKVETVDADPQQIEVGGSPLEYYNVTVEVIFRRPLRTTPDKAWFNRRVEKGNYVKNDGGDLVPAMIQGEQAPGPVFLDANGKQTNSDSAIWSEDEIFGRAAFSGMGFNF